MSCALALSSHASGSAVIAAAPIARCLLARLDPGPDRRHLALDRGAHLGGADVGSLGAFLEHFLAMDREQSVRTRVVEGAHARLGPRRALDLALAQAAEQLHLEMVVTLAQRRAPFAGEGAVAALEGVDRRGRDAGGL